MTRRESLPVGYDPRLDRRQPPPLGCLNPVVLGPVLLVALASMIWGISSINQAPPVPTVGMELANLSALELEASPLPTDTVLPSDTPLPTETFTLTPDSWGLTGTALIERTATRTPKPTLTATEASTLNYCWWLTPSPTPTATWHLTPDSWGATGTAIWSATHPYHTATPGPRRELCRDIPTWTATIPTTPTFTPFPLPGGKALGGTPPITLPYIAPPATWTPPPTQPPPQVIERDVPIEVVITSPPQIIQITSPPIIIVEPTSPPQVIVITATIPTSPTPTNTELPTATPTPTATATDTPTATPTATETIEP